MIEKGSMFKAWEATTEQQKKAHEMQAIYKAQETARQAIQEAMNRYIKKKTLPPLEHPVLTVDAYGNYHTNTEYIDTPEIPFCITYNDGRFWPPIAWSKFEQLKQGGD